MKENMTIRRLCDGDRESYLALCGEFYKTDAVMAPVPSSHFSACFDEMLTRDTYALGWMFLLDGIPVGYAQASRTYSQEAGGTVVWIEELYLRPAYRSLGFGSAFFDLVEHEFPAVRYRLEVEEENVGAVRLYERMGFRFIPYRQMMKGQ